MKTASKIIVTLLLVVIMLPPAIFAQEIPFGVSPKELVETGMISGLPDTQYGMDKQGNLLQSYEYKVGNRIGIKLEGIEYSLRFWNVGKLGGTSGFLFWKKDYSKAVLTLTPIAANNGIIVADRIDNRKIGMKDGWKMEDATGEPEFRSVACHLTFAGGPSGEFEGECNEGERVKGRLVQGRAFIFTEVSDPEKQETFDLVRSKELPLSDRAFGDWKVETVDCEDSQTRFNSISGTVEVASDTNAKENSWGFGRLESVLCVDDHVRTGEESEAILSFADMSTYIMAPETEIIINSPPKKDSKLGLVYGKIKANVKRMMEDGTMEIEMSQGAMSIKGTRFILTETGSESKVEVTEGSVEFRAKKNGETIVVNAGEAVTATATGFSEKTVFDPTALDAELITDTNTVSLPQVTPANEAKTQTDGSKSASQTALKPATVIPTIALLAVLMVGILIFKRKKKNKS